LEHARPDHPAWDIVKLRTEVWPHQPAAEHAFRQGYGPLPLERTLERLCWLHALQTRTWGRDHADASAVAVGERALLHLIARRSPG
ncbi:MAG: hypothetical protein VX265_13010, partial [Myxococcota bacterium]|nr:hypothetical protein [Myxococcota bacterium]MEC8425617.1 hypothetical protein [Myxococcota bacterium]